MSYEIEGSSYAHDILDPVIDIYGGDSSSTSDLCGVAGRMRALNSSAPRSALLPESFCICESTMIYFACPKLDNTDPTLDVYGNGKSQSCGKMESVSLNRCYPQFDLCQYPYCSEVNTNRITDPAAYPHLELYPPVAQTRAGNFSLPVCLPFNCS